MESALLEKEVEDAEMVEDALEAPANEVSQIAQERGEKGESAENEELQKVLEKDTEA